MENFEDKLLAELTIDQKKLYGGGILMIRWKWIKKGVEYLGLLDAAEDFGEGFIECATN